MSTALRAVAATLRVVSIGIASLGVASIAQAENRTLSVSLLEPQGPARSLALAGATLALPRNETAFGANPAAAIFQEEIFEASYASNRQWGQSSPLPGTALRDRGNSVVGLQVRIWPEVAAVAGIRSFDESHTRALTGRSAYGFQSLRMDVPLGIAVRPMQRLGVSLGVVFLNETLKRSTSLTSNASLGEESARAGFEGTAWQAGALVALDENLSVGVLYQSEAVLRRVNASLAPQVGDGVTLRSYRPALGQLGAVLYVPSVLDLIALVQLDVLHRGPSLGHAEQVMHAGALVHESAPKTFDFDTTASAFEDAALYESAPRYVPRLGLETLVYRDLPFAARAQLGCYLAPQELKGTSVHPHLTAGFEISAWNFIAQVAFDFARGQSYRSFGVAVASR